VSRSPSPPPSREELEQRFTGSTGLQPQAEARRYVYGVLWAMLDNEHPGDGGWIYGGIENEFDVRRLKKAVAAVQKELLRKRDR
jgi:hypothetical protein